MEYVKLNDGSRIPALGIGTFMLQPDDCESAVLAALECGYRHIDTANAYLNERACGRAIKKSGIPRDEVYLTTKLFPCSYKEADRQIDATLKRLDVDHIDLMLLHQPYGDVKAAWQALERAVRAGKLRSIGISNFEPKDTKKLLSYAAIKPALLQCECHPYHAMDDVRKDIQIEAWYPLGHGDTGLLSEPVFAKLAERYGKTPVQIVLRWHIQKGNIAIPGSKNPDHIRSNMDIFDFSLTGEDMAQIAKLDGRKKFFKMPAPMSLAMPMMKMDFEAQK